MTPNGNRDMTSIDEEKHRGRATTARAYRLWIPPPLLFTLTFRCRSLHSATDLVIQGRRDRVVLLRHGTAGKTSAETIRHGRTGNERGKGGGRGLKTPPPHLTSRKFNGDYARAATPCVRSHLSVAIGPGMITNLITQKRSYPSAPIALYS
ncbi:hypothetical protein LY78DRAFT_341040 [Colletotrichum sublineola]|nr:hypothetical protein LY78DRAFT_341040 [Colletotrichum sublineola]